MLFTVPGYTANNLSSFTQADSLIRQELSDFNIQPQYIHTEPVDVDSIFSRKIFHVEVPGYLSKTQIHAELNEIFYDYSIKTPARVTFPEKNMNIHLLHEGTIIRTISLKTSDS